MDAMVRFDRARMERHVARQDAGYAAGDAHAIQNSTLVRHSRIHKELFLLSSITEDMLAMESVGRLLEAGCGVGTMTGALRSIAADVVAFDLSPAGVSAAQKKYSGWPGIAVVQADGTDPQSCPEIAVGGFDVILFREFHPFTRDFYDDRGAANRAHDQILAAYARLLAPGGAIVISHAESKPQAIRPEAFTLPDGLEILVARVDPRLVAAFLFLTRNDLDRAIALARLCRPLVWRIASHNVMYVLRKRREDPA